MSRTRLILGVENERADAGWDGRTCLVTSSTQARTGTGKIYFLCSADHKQESGNYTELIHTLLNVRTKNNNGVPERVFNYIID